VSQETVTVYIVKYLNFLIQLHRFVVPLKEETVLCNKKGTPISYHSLEESNVLLYLQKLYTAVIFMWKMYKCDSLNYL